MDSSEYQLGFLNRSVKREYDDLLVTLRLAEKTAFNQALTRLRQNPYPAPGDPARLIAKVGSQWRYRVTYRHRLLYLIEGKQVVITSATHRKDAYRNL